MEQVNLASDNLKEGKRGSQQRIHPSVILQPIWFTYKVQDVSHIP